MQADRDLLGTALGNIITNAAEAMPNGGRLVIRAESVAADAEIENRVR